MSHPPHTDNYRPDIDGLRAVAVSAVVIHHAFPQFFPGGFIGVDIFFVISGYLISSIILDNLARNRLSFADFYARRVKRIFPALFLVLAFTLVYGWFVLSPLEYKAVGKHALAGSFFLSNFAFWQEAGYFDASAVEKPLLHLWSLAIEEQFYIFWPLTLLALHRGHQPKKVWILALLLLSLGVNLWLVRRDLTAAFYNPMGRFWEMMMGAYLAASRPAPGAAAQGSGARAQWLSTLGILLLALVMFKLHPERRFPGGWAFVGTLATCLLIAAGPRGWFNRYVLSSKPVVWIGLISYPLYLWHWPLLAYPHIELGEAPRALHQIGWVLLAVLLAWLTYRLVERPIRFGHWRQWRFTTVALGAGVALSGLTGFTIYQQEGQPERLQMLAANRASSDGTPEQTQALLATLSSKGGRSAVTEGWRDGDCMLDFKALPSQYKPFCVEKKRPLVFLWGDSHAGSLYPGFKALQDSGQYSFGLGERTAAICPPILGIEPRPRCRSLNDDTIRVIRETKPDVVVLYAWWHEGKVKGRYKDTSGLEPTVAELKKAGVKRIVLLGAVPYWREDLPKLLLKEWKARQRLPLRLGDEFLDPHVKAATAEMRQRAAAMGIEFISGMDSFCNRDGCLSRMESGSTEPLSYDYGHLSLPAVKYYVQQIAPRILGKS
ncbi:acyltransferase [Hydrogenophaga taeniospiralis]|uniref:acyltransferase family protein n=1 Tax=Hydrogenophaga taeniospiralis TaxID=65656 RepID=UPI001CF98109|nr:acyltransferase family protein [Hydrogenophaga taeniospiralis]MCB4364674.1 acyltransferase [Hydrogenophaga taeniospiralis]